MRVFDDGRVDARRAVTVDEQHTDRGTPEALRAEIDAFRGRVLSAAYALERRLDALIVWHLFGDRQDGAAGFFEENILHEGGFGLERKVRVARKIAAEWHWEGDEEQSWESSLTAAKRYRDRVAHWPMWLQPCVLPTGETIGYRAHLEKGDESYAMDEGQRRSWIEELESCTRAIETTISRVIEHRRSGLEE